MLPISLSSEGCCKAQDESLYKKTKALFHQILGVFTVAFKLVVLVVHGGRVGVVSVTVHQQDGTLPTGPPGPGPLWTQQRRARLGTRVPLPLLGKPATLPSTLRSRMVYTSCSHIRSYFGPESGFLPPPKTINKFSSCIL